MSSAVLATSNIRYGNGADARPNIQESGARTLQGFLKPIQSWKEHLGQHVEEQSARSSLSLEDLWIGIVPATCQRPPLCSIDHFTALQVRAAYLGEESISEGRLEQRQQIWGATIDIAIALEQTQRNEYIEHALDQRSRDAGAMTQVGEAT